MSTFIQTSILVFIIFHIQSSSSSVTYNVADFGAKPDGATDSASAFMSAWSAACGSAWGSAATIYFPPGTYLVGGSTSFVGEKCNSNGISVRMAMEGATLVGPWDYRVLGKARNWLSFEGVSNVSIYGGMLDARGGSLWDCKASSGYPHNTTCPPGAKSLSFVNSRDIKMIGLSSVNSQKFNIGLNRCNNVTMVGVNASAPAHTPETDGLLVQLSTLLTILNSTFSSGHDCITIGPGSAHLFIHNVTCNAGHGISIGSLARNLEEEGVRNVTLITATIKGTDNGVWIKTWGKPSNGFVTDVLFQDITMVNVSNPIIIDQNYCSPNMSCPFAPSGVKISNVTYRNIRGTSATKVAVTFNCSKTNPCSGIRLEDINLSYGYRHPAKAYCANARGTASHLVKPPSCLKSNTAPLYNLVQ